MQTPTKRRMLKPSVELSPLRNKKNALIAHMIICMSLKSRRVKQQKQKKKKIQTIRITIFMESVYEQS